MPATRVMPTEESAELIRLVRDFAAKELLPRSAAAEAEEAFPRDVFAMLGELGVLGLPYAEEHGGGGQPYEVYLQVLEEIASVWASVGVGVSVHALSCFGLVTRGTDEQRSRWLPEMLGGGLLGAYCLSEAHAGSDPAAMRTTARRDGDDYVINGAKAWTTHGGHADFYKVMARTSDDRNGISCFLVPADSEGLVADAPERKMGLTGSATATMRFDGVRVPAERRLGDEGDGFGIGLALDGRFPTATGCGSPSKGSTPGGSASPRSRRGWRRARSTTPRRTRRSGRPSGSRSSTTRASPSCSPTWRPPCSRRGPPPSTPPGCATPGSRSAARPASPSWSPPTTR